MARTGVSEMEYLLRVEIDWRQVPGSLSEWYAYIDGKEYHLLLGDFPDEPLYTLVGDDGKLPVEERPRHWRIEGVGWSG